MFQCPTCGFQSVNADAFVGHSCGTTAGAAMTSTVDYQEMFPLLTSFQQSRVSSDVSDVLEVDMPASGTYNLSETVRPASRASDSSEDRPASRASNSSETETNCLERWDDRNV